VDARHFSPSRRDATLRAAWGLGPDDLAVIYVGRIAAEKNLELSIRAFRRIQQLQPTAKFVWVGDGPVRERLAQENPDFIFCGVQRGDALARHFASGDLFLFSSHSETFGNVTLEAMASGVPTVAFNYGAAREHLIDGVHGAAVDNDDDFIGAALRLAGDAPARRAMADAASDAMRALHPDQVSADFDALLTDLALTRRSHHASVAAA
jgi:glycosyltransferase involved in cell wall biosynthesis